MSSVSFQTLKGSPSKDTQNVKARIKVKSDELYGHHDRSGDDVSEDELRKVRKHQVNKTNSATKPKANLNGWLTYAGETTEEIPIRIQSHFEQSERSHCKDSVGKRGPSTENCGCFEFSKKGGCLFLLIQMKNV